MFRKKTTKFCAKKFWLEESDDDDDDDDDFMDCEDENDFKVNKPNVRTASQMDGKSQKTRKKIRLNSVPSVTGYSDQAALAARPQNLSAKPPLRRSLFSPNKKKSSKRLTISPVAKPKRKTYTRKRRPAAKRWDIPSIVKKSNPGDIDFIVKALSQALPETTTTTTQKKTRKKTQATGGEAAEVEIEFPQDWTTQRSFRVQGVGIKMGFTKVLPQVSGTPSDVYRFKISESRAVKVVAEIERARQNMEKETASATTAVVPPSTTTATAEAVSAVAPPNTTETTESTTKSSKKSKSKKKKKKKSKKAKASPPTTSTAATTSTASAAVTATPPRVCVVLFLFLFVFTLFVF